MKRVLFIFTTAVLILSLLAGCKDNNADKDDAQLFSENGSGLSSAYEYPMYPVTKVVFSDSLKSQAAWQSLSWDYNGDGAKDRFYIECFGSGILHESLYCTDAVTEETTLLGYSENAFFGLGFAEGDDSTPLIFSHMDALLSEDGGSALVEPLAKIEVIDGKPAITNLMQDGNVKYKYHSVDDSGNLIEKEIAVQDAGSKGFIDDGILEDLEGFYAEVRFDNVITADGVMRTEFVYKTLCGQEAKELYRIIRSAADSVQDDTNHFDAYFDSIKCRFIVKKASNDKKVTEEYCFCGSFGVQKRGEKEYMEIKTGAPHDARMCYELKQSVYEDVDRVIKSAR